jgi:hypothetical protein
MSSEGRQIEATSGFGGFSAENVSRQFWLRSNAKAKAQRVPVYARWQIGSIVD